MKNFFSTKRLLALLLASAMVITSVPEVALAAGIDEDTQAAAIAEEEVFEEGAGDVIEPDDTAGDIMAAIVAATNSNFATFLNVDGTNPGAAVATYSVMGTEPAISSNPFYFDSENGATILIAPKFGYEIKDATALAAAIKVEGSYTPTTGSETAIAVNTDYEIAPNTIADLGNGLSPDSTYDFSRAYWVTVKPGTWLTAYKNAEHGITGAGSVTKRLKVTIADGSFTKRSSTMAVVDGKAGILPATIEPDKINTTDFAIGTHFPAATGYEVKSVAFVKGSEAVEFTKELANNTPNMTGTKLAYYTDGTNINFSTYAIKSLFSTYEDYRLTVTIAAEEAKNYAKIKTDGTTLLTFKGADAIANGTYENTKGKYTVAINATGVDAYGDTAMYPFMAELATASATTGRTIDKVSYSVDGSDKKAAAPLDINGATSVYQVNAAAYNFDGTTSGASYSSQSTPTDTSKGGKFWAIPKADVDGASEIVISATTKESIVFHFTEDDGGSTHYPYATVWDGTDYKTNTVTASTAVNSGVTEPIATGSAYSFKVIGKANYNVKSVTAKMKSVDGSGTQNVVITKGDGSVYTATLPNGITGQLDITIATEPVAATGLEDVKLNATGAFDAIDLESGKTLGTGLQALATTGGTYKFRLTPKDEAGSPYKTQYISKVEYKMAGGAKAEIPASGLSYAQDGTVDCTLPETTSGSIEIFVTTVDGTRLVKTANPDVTLTVNGETLADGKTALVKAATDVTVTATAASGATLKGMYHSAAAATSAPISAVGETLMNPTTTGGTTFVIPASAVAYTANAKNIYLTAVTTKPATGYTATFTSATSKGKAITSLDLYAQTSTSTTVVDQADLAGLISNTVSVVVKDNTSKLQVNQDAGSAWSLVDDAAANAVVKFTTAADMDLVFRSNEKAGSNTIKYVYTEGFPQGTSYEATLPVTTKALNTFFTKFELVGAVTASSTAVTNGGNPKAGLDGADTAIRVDSASTPTIADAADYTIKAYYPDTNDDGEDESVTIIATNNKNIELSATALITAIQWKVSPELNAATDLTAAYALTPSAANTETLKIDDPTKAQDLAVSAELTFADGSKTTVTEGGALKVVDETYGYVAVPVMTINGKTDFAPATQNLALKTEGYKNAKLTWRVFKQLKSSLTSGWNASDTAIQTAITAKEVEEVTTGLTYGEPTLSNTSGFVTVTGTDEVVVNATKVGGPTTVTPNITVNGCPVAVLTTPGAVPAFTVVNELATATVTFATGDQTAVTVPTNIDAIADYQYPALATNFSSIGKVSKIASVVSGPASTAGTAAEKIVAIQVSKVAYGQEITLPAQSDFTAGTYNPKKTLIGWKVETPAVTYKYPGDKINITGNTKITPIWAFKYQNALGSGGVATLYKKLGSEWVAIDGGTPAATGSITASYGASVPIAIGYYALKSGNDAMNSSGVAQYNTELTTTITGLTLTPTSGAANVAVATVSDEMTLSPAFTTGSAEFTVKWVDGTDEYSTYNAGLTAKTDALSVATLTVNNAAAATYTVVPNPDTDPTVSKAITDLTANMTREIALVVKNSVPTQITERNSFADVDVKVADESIVGFEWSIATASATNSLTKFKLIGKKAGGTTVTITVTDANGNKATGVQNVTVAPQTLNINATLVNEITGKEGKAIAASEDAMVLGDGASNKIYLSLSSGADTVNTDWAFAYTDVSTVSGADVAAWTGTSNGAATATDYNASTQPINHPYITVPSVTALGLKTLTVKYTNPTTHDVISREIPVRSYYAVAVKGARSAAPTQTYKTATKESEVFVVKNGSANIAEDGVSYITVPYVSGVATAGVYTGKYDAALTGYSASLVDTTDTSLEFKGWKENAGILFDGTAADYEKNATISLTDSVWASTATYGILPLSAVFGLPSDTYYFTGLTTINGKDAIELDDSKLSTTTVAGSDIAAITIDVTPYNSSTVLTVSGSNKGMLHVTKDTTATAAGRLAAAAPGFGTGGEFAGTATDLNKGVDGLSRTDKFVVDKIYTTGNTSKNTVGVTTLYVKDKAATPNTIKEITVYLNGEFKDTEATGTPMRYMYRGEILESGVKTVAGEEHIYSDSKRVTDGVADVTIDGKAMKVLVIGGSWYKTAGRKTYDSNTYYIDENGAVITSKLYKDGEKTYYLNNEGVAVTYAMATDDRGEEDGKKFGKYTDPETKTTYKIFEDGTAVEDDRLGFKSIEWDKKPAIATFVSSLPVITAKVTFTSQKGKTYAENPVTLTAKVTLTEKTEKKATYTAVVDLSQFYDSKYATKLTTESKEYVYTVDKNGDISDKGQSIDITTNGISIEGLEEEYLWTGAAIQPAFKVVDGDKTLAKGVDYTVKFATNKNVGKATVTVTGKGNYAGANSVGSFQIVDPMKDVDADDLAGNVKSVAKPAAMTYTGEPLYPETLTVTLTDKSTVTLTGDGNGAYSNSSGKDLVVSVSNNVNKGNATVAVTGKDNKTKKATFKINAAPITGLTDSDITVADTAEYRVKGATVDIALSFNGEDLVAGQDYTTKYKDNKKAGSATVTISGKGNFSGKLGDKTFTVTPLSLDDCVFDAATVYAGSTAKSIKATVLDPDGDALKAKTDYTLSFEGDDAVDAKGKLVDGKDIKIIATAAGSNIEKDTTADKTFTIGYNLAKAKVAVTKGFAKEYTGTYVTLEDADWSSLTVTIKAADKTTKTLKVGEDFVVAGYTNNIKKGKMTVTLAGTGTATENGTFSGTKPFKVTINAKPITK